MDTVITVENLSKVYSLGTISGGTLRDDVRHFLSKLKGREDQYLKGHSESEMIWSLKDVSFDIKRGEVLGVVGKNGAGKSTLLKILSRVTAPTSGEIKIKGRVASLLEVGTGFHPELTGKENIFLNGAIMGMTKKEIKSKFDEIVDFSGVERFIDTPVKRYSSGMYVRLAFAVAAYLDPEILIIDEVLAVGDADFQKKCLGRMKDVANDGRTVVFVSHNAIAVKSLCSRAIFLEHGRLTYNGDVDKTIKLYFGEKANMSYVRTWQGDERPGNEDVKINHVKLLDESNQDLKAVIISKPFYIEINFEVLSDAAKPIFSLSLHASNEEVIFGSISNLEPGYENLSYQAGVYKIACQIPANFLNDGSFEVGINAYSAGFNSHIPLASAIGFEAFDDGALMGDYKGTFGGYMRPFLDWKTTRI